VTTAITTKNRQKQYRRSRVEEFSEHAWYQMPWRTQNWPDDHPEVCLERWPKCSLKDASLFPEDCQHFTLSQFCYN
jgi:hypothetical protein